MESRIVAESDMSRFKGQIPQNTIVSYFKIVNAGPKTLSQAKGDSGRLSRILAKVSGFFLISDMETTREELHQLVDRYCDILEKNRGK